MITNDFLEKRIHRFENVCLNMKCIKTSPLSAIVKIDEQLFESLKYTASKYLSRVLKSKKNLTGKQIIENFDKQRHTLPNITPGGLILPKNYSSIEYNDLMKKFYSVISLTMKCDEKIDSWFIPMSMRVKYSQKNKINLNSRYETESMHMDSWSGYSSFGITCILPLFGDVVGNSIDFWELKNEVFEEEWMKPPLTAGKFDRAKQEKIIKQYKKINFERRPGYMFLTDGSIIHKTYRDEKGCGTRISIDHIFVPKVSDSDKKYEYVSKERMLESMKYKELMQLGNKQTFIFEDTDNDIRDSKKGIINPTGYNVQKIKKVNPK